MLRYLTERLPAMVAPRWVNTRIQPIAVRDVLRYLVGSAAMPADVSRTFDIGGPEVLTYREMMQRYAAVAGLPPRVIRAVPVLTPRLSSLWVGLVTPVPAGIARPLVGRSSTRSSSRSTTSKAYVPDPPDGLVGFDRAVELALAKIRDLDVRDLVGLGLHARRALRPVPRRPGLGGRQPLGGRARCRRGRGPAVPVVGHRGHRRRPRLVLLAARLGGARRAWTGSSGARACAADAATRTASPSATPWTGGAWRRSSRAACCGCARRCACPAWPGSSSPSRRSTAATVFRQRAIYHPRGLLGQAYWWAVYAFHGIVFGGMQRNIARAAEAAACTRAGV